MGARSAGGVGLMIAGVVVLVMSGLALFFTSYEIPVTFLVIGVVFIAVGSQPAVCLGQYFCATGGDAETPTCCGPWSRRWR